MGVELGAPALGQLFSDVCRIARSSVRAVGIHGIESVRDGHDAGFLGDFFSFQPLGVARAVVAFVVTSGHGLGCFDDAFVL
jgi:hypothetical protein